MVRRFNPAQKRDALGRWTSGVAVVPYARASTRSTTLGVNSGAPISRRYRLSAGAYVRLERRAPTATEQAVRSKYDDVIKKVAPHPATEGLIKSAVSRVAVKALRHQVNLPGGKASARFGTSRYGVPSVTVRRGRSKVSSAARAKGINDYNKAMNGRKLAKAAVKTPRPQRRGKNA